MSGGFGLTALAASLAVSVPPGRYHVVAVLAPTEQEARDALTSLVDVTLYARAFGLAADVPLVLAPNEAKWAPPDQFVVALSFCAKKADAAARVSISKRRISGISLLLARGQYENRCLPRRAFDRLSVQEVEHIKIVLSDQQSARARVEYANFLQSEGRLAESETQLQKAIEIDPDHREAQTLLRMVRLLRRP